MLKNSQPKILQRYGCLIALLLAMMLAGSCATDKYKYLRQGHKYAAGGEWDNSVRFFQKAHEEDPENTEINLMLKRSKFESSHMHMINGESYLAQELFNEAINEFRISMAMNPANIRAAELEGKAQRQRARLDAFEMELEQLNALFRIEIEEDRMVALLRQAAF
jgi:tetratricopeptide (TPR) repeat protein